MQSQAEPQQVLPHQSAAPNALIENIYTTGLVQDAEGKTMWVLGSGVTYPQGMALYNFVYEAGAKRTLEIGLAHGVSTLFLCQAHADRGDGGMHVAVDPGQSTFYRSIGLLNIQRAGLANHVTFYEACSYEILPQLLEKGERFDFIFIDGRHTFDYTLVDFFYSDLLLNVGGHIMFDDVWMPSVRKALMYVLRNRRYQLVAEQSQGDKSLWQRTKTYLSSILQPHDQADPTKYNYDRARLKMLATYCVKNPLDFSSIYSALHIGRKGGLGYLSVQKMAEDSREWHYHTAF